MAHNHYSGSRVLPVVLMIAAGVCGSVFMWLVFGLYGFLALGGLTYSIAAFIFSDFDLTGLVYLLPLFLAGCLCVILGIRRDKMDTDSGEKKAPADAGKRDR